MNQTNGKAWLSETRLNKILLNKTLKFTIIDIAAILFIVAAISLFFLRMSQVLEYNWEWDVIPSYFFYLDEATGKLKANIFVKGFVTTIKLSVWATLMGFLLGTVVPLILR